MPRFVRVSSLVLWLVILVVGCDGVPGDLEDASVDAGATGSSLALPSWDTCPEGWTREDVEGASSCAPPARLVCEGASFQPTGASACEPVDDACGAGRFRDVRDAARTYVFVDASAAGGDGSEASPYASVDAAIAAGATSLLLAAGDYTIGATVPDGLELRGVCADRTHLVAAAGRMAILVPPSRTVSLVGLSVTGTGIGPAARGTLVMDRVALTPGLEGWGAGFNGGSLIATRVLVRAPVPSTRASGVGVGLSLIAGSQATLTDVVIEDARGVGIQVEESRVEGDRVVVQRTRAEPSGAHGGGVSVAGSGTLTLRDALVSDVFDFGITAQSSSAISLTRVRIEGVSTLESDRSGRGLEVWDSAATLEDLDVIAASSIGLYVRGAGDVLASDLAVRATREVEGLGGGVLVEGTLTLDRAQILDTSFTAITVSEGVLDARDVTVARVVASRHFGAALACTDAARCSVDRLRFEALHTIGVAAIGTGTELMLSNGSVRGVAVEETYDMGRAIEIDTGAHGVLRGLVISDVVETAIVAFALDASDRYVEGTRLELEDVSVSGIAERACVSSTCATEGGGTGVAALAGASIVGTRLRVTGAPLCGVQVYDAASLDLSEGTIEGSAIGACVQIEGYDLARVVEGVRYVDNERNVESASVYVPARAPTP